MMIAQTRASFFRNFVEDDKISLISFEESIIRNLFLLLNLLHFFHLSMKKI